MRIRVRKLTSDERDKLLFVCRVQRLPCYREIVRRLTLKHSVWAVATWLKEQNLGGPAGRWTHHYWRKLLTPLAEQVRRAREKVVRKERAGKTLLIPPKPEEVQSVLAEVVTPQSQLRNAMPAATRDVWKHVEETTQALRAESILKYAFMVQQARIVDIVESEKQMPPMMRILQADIGTKAINALREIGDSIRKLEIGEEWMRGKGGSSALPYGGPYPGAVLPHGQAEQSDIARGMAQFDAVDRNLIREATMNVLDMIDHEAAKLKASRLTFDAGGEVAAEETSN